MLKRGGGKVHQDDSPLKPIFVDLTVEETRENTHEKIAQYLIDFKNIYLEIKKKIFSKFLIEPLN